VTDGGAFERLHTSVKHALWDMRWTELRRIQVEAIRAVLDSDDDILITAQTAGGKTEAAFLPILSEIADAPFGSVKALYVGPLKALINDQFRRLEDLCARTEVPVHRWHGDVSRAKKRKLIQGPSGVLLITPESIESLFINKSPQLAALFGDLRYVVVDEVHAFMGTERGKHCQSLLSRIDHLLRTPARRVGLSATIGNVDMARTWLRSSAERNIHVICGDAERDLAVLVKGYRKKAAAHSAGPNEADTKSVGDDLDVATAIFRAFRGTTNLIFGNRKSKLEYYADLLGQISKRHGCPIEFLIHHGSLSKAIREEAETLMKSGRPFTTLCTNTLELGIDIGYVDTIGQLDPPFSVSALTQRIGRSGRKEGAAARLLFYIQELEPDSQSPPWHTLYQGLLQAVAMVELLLEGWCESPPVGRLHYSTLVQQVLSILAQTGGTEASRLYHLLAQRGAFQGVTESEFVALLRSLGQHDLVEQMPEGDIILGLTGQRIVRSKDFYAAFKSPEEYRVLADGKLVATLPVLFPIPVGEHVILGGKRWQVVERDDRRKEMVVVRARGAKPPFFVSGYGQIAPEIRAKMRELLSQTKMPKYLDASAEEMLQEARDTANRLRLQTKQITESGSGTAVFTWTGSRINHTLMLAGQAAHLDTSDIGVGLYFEGVSVAKVTSFMRGIAANGLDGRQLAEHSDTKEVEKYDMYLPEELRLRAFERDELDIPGAVHVASSLDSH
jgi:ATP-dependent Lhr-like helicase